MGLACGDESKALERSPKFLRIGLEVVFLLYPFRSLEVLSWFHS